MFEWMLVYGTELIGALLNGLLYAWYCSWFAKSRFRHSGISVIGCGVAWMIVANIFDFSSLEGFGVYFLLQFIWVVLRMIIALVFYVMERDKLIYISVLFSSAVGILRFTVQRLIGLSYLQIPWMDICLKLSPNGEVFFFLNKAVLVVQLMLLDLVVAFSIFLYGKIVRRLLKDTTHCFSVSELFFLLLPSLASLVEIRNITYLLARQISAADYSRNDFWDYDNTIIETLSMLVMLLLLVMSIINIGVYQKLRDTINEQTKQKMLIRQNADMRRHLDEMARLNETVRGVKHDMKNHIAVLERLVSDVDGHEELKDYLERLGGSARQMETHFSTGLVVVDALLDGKASEAKKRLGEDVILRADDLIFPNNLKIHEYDIAVIVGNALDNAIEACEKVADNIDMNNECVISVSSDLRGNMLLLEVKNPFSGTVRINRASGYPMTDKTDASEHGIGFLNMKMIAEKYYGAVDYRAEDGVFILNVALQNTLPRE